jgi:hypothetical protein
LLLRFGIEADVARDSTVNQAGTDQLADPPAGHRRVVGYDSQPALFLTDDFIDQTLGSSDSHKPTDHHGGAIRNEAHSIMKMYCFHRRRTSPIF